MEDVPRPGERLPLPLLLLRREKQLTQLRNLYSQQFSRLERLLQQKHEAYVADRTKVTFSSLPDPDFFYKVFFCA